MERQLIELRLQDDQQAGVDHQRHETVIDLTHTDLVLIARGDEMDAAQEKQDEEESQLTPSCS